MPIRVTHVKKSEPVTIVVSTLQRKQRRKKQAGERPGCRELHTSPKTAGSEKTAAARGRGCPGTRRTTSPRDTQPLSKAAGNRVPQRSRSAAHHAVPRRAPGRTGQRSGAGKEHPQAGAAARHRDYAKYFKWLEEGKFTLGELSTQLLHAGLDNRALEMDPSKPYGWKPSDDEEKRPAWAPPPVTERSKPGLKAVFEMFDGGTARPPRPRSGFDARDARGSTRDALIGRRPRRAPWTSRN